MYFSDVCKLKQPCTLCIRIQSNTRGAQRCKILYTIPKKSDTEQVTYLIVLKTNQELSKPELMTKKGHY